MPRRGGGRRSGGFGGGSRRRAPPRRSPPRRQASSRAPPPAKTQAPPAQQSAPGGGMGSGLGGMVATGMALGAGSAIGHAAVGGVMNAMSGDSENDNYAQGAMMSGGQLSKQMNQYFSQDGGE